MKIHTTPEKIIKSIENSTAGLPIAFLISEKIIKIEKDGQIQDFRLREFNDKIKNEHLKLMKEISENPEYTQEMQENLDNFGRNFTINDFTAEEYDEVKILVDEVIDYFKK